MTTEQATQIPESATTPDPNLDGFLRLLTNFVNGTDRAMPVVLTVGGFVIAGDLVSGHKFFEAIADSIVKDVNDVSAEDAAGLKSFADDFRSFGEPYLKEIDENTPLPVYVHLRNAITLHHSGKPIPAKGGAWWRGKIASVDGYTLGTVTVTQE